MKKTVSIILVLVLLFSLSSCDRKYDEEEVRAAACELIAKSEELNYIFWGEGIGYIEDESTSSGYYHRANYVDLDKFGFSTVEEIKNRTRKVFSSDYCDSIFSAVFSSYGDDDGLYGLARYYQKYTDESYTEPECIMVYSKATVLLKDETEYLFDTLKVVGSKKETVYVTISINVTRDGDTQTHEKKIGLIEEEDGWRIDTPTYMSYIEK